MAVGGKMADLPSLRHGLSEGVDHNIGAVVKLEVDDDIPQCDNPEEDECNVSIEVETGSDCEIEDNTTGELPQIEGHLSSETGLWNTVENDDHEESDTSSGTTENLFRCPLCEKIYNVEDLFKRHLRTHTATKRHKCEHCEKSFNTPSELKIHMHSHTGDRPYICNICSKGFTKPALLKAHMDVHTGKRHQCPTCEKYFASSGYLKMHMRKHTGQFVLKVCWVF